MIRKQLVLVWTLCMVILFAACSGNKSDSGKSKSGEVNREYKVIGYVAGWTGMDISSVQVKKLTHVNYAFANIVDGKATFMKEFDKPNLEMLTSLRDSSNPDLKILYSIGGWVWSNGFTEASSTQEKRVAFAESAVKLMRDYKLDGVDLDWEYPGRVGEDNRYSADDKVNFTLLLKACREALDRASKEDSRSGKQSYLLTIATGAGPSYTMNTNLGEASKYLDFINIMTYDLYNGGDKFTGHQANLNSTEKHGPKQISCKSAVDGHIAEGVPVGKIVLGVPFYGRKWTGVESSKDGLWQHAESVGSIISYKEIKSSYFTADDNHLWDSEAQAAYLYNKKSRTFISYEDSKTVEIKIAYIKEKGLGGAMFWEYSDDYNSELLNSLTKLKE